MLGDKIGRAVSAALDIGEDVTKDLSKLVLNGDEEIICGGYKGLIEYSPEEIKINLKGKSLSIEGEKLMIKAIESEEIVISGVIKSIEFL